MPDPYAQFGGGQIDTPTKPPSTDSAPADPYQSFGGFSLAPPTKSAPKVSKDDITKIAKEYGVPPELALSVAKIESADNPDARSNKGAMGVMQLMPGTAIRYKVNDPWDADQNIHGGMAYLRDLLKQFKGDWNKALAAYNWGEGNVEAGKKTPSGVNDYVSSVRGGIDDPYAKFGGQILEAAPQGSAPGKKSQYAKEGSYKTELPPEQEQKFQQWVKSNHVPFEDDGPQSTYDMRGYWKAMTSGDPRAKQELNASDKRMHFPDIWKTPYHPTFSNESIYANPDAPHWDNDRLVDKNGKVVSDETPKQNVPHGDTGAKIESYNPGWWTRLTGPSGAHGATGEYSQTAQVTGDKAAALARFMNHPLLAFEELFPANPQTKMGQFGKGAARSASGMTSPGMIAMQAAGEVAAFGDLLTAVKAVGTAMMPTILEGIYGAHQKAEQAKKSGDSEQEMEAWGEIAGNVALIAVPHIAGNAVESYRGGQVLDSAARETYNKKFTELSDQEKVGAMYAAIEKQSPEFRRRVDREVAKLKKNAPSSAEGASRVVNEQGQRIEAAKNALTQIVERQRREQVYKQDQAKKEAAVREQQRQQRYLEEKAAAQKDVVKSHAEERGFGVEESRHTELGFQRQLDLERDHVKAAANSREMPPKDTEAFQTIEALNKVASDQFQTDYRYLTPDRKLAVLTEAIDHADPSVRERVQAEVSELQKGRPGVSEQALSTVERQRQATRAVVSALDSIQQQYIAEKKAAEGGESQAGKRGFSVDDQRHIQLGNLRELYLEAAKEVSGGNGQVVGSLAEPVVSESPKTIAKQLEALKRGTIGTVMIPRGGEVPAVPEGMKSITVDEGRGAGTYIFDPKKVSEAEIVKAAKAGTHGKLLGHLQDKMTLAGKDTVVVQAVDKDGTPVQDSQVENSPKSIEAQKAELQRRHPGAEIRVTSPQDVLSARGGVQGQPESTTSQEGGAAPDSTPSEMVGRMSDRDAVSDDLHSAADLAMIRTEQDARQKTIADTIKQSGTSETKESERVTTDSNAAVEAARKLGASTWEEAVKLADSMRRGAESKITPDGQEFLTRMRRAEVAAETESLRQFRDETAQKIKSSEDGKVDAVKELAATEDQRAAVDRAITRAESDQQAQDLRRTSDYLKRKEDAIIAAAEQAAPRQTKAPLAKIPVVSGQATRVVLNSGEQVPAHYAVVEARDLIQSHDPESFHWVQAYPREAQPRDYSTDKPAQAGVVTDVNNLDPGQLLSDSVLPVDGPPIILQNGVVMGGNGRTMRMKLAMRLGRGNYDAVRKSLLDKASVFGFTQDELAKMKEPVLVRVMDADVSDPGDLTRYGLEYNRAPVRGISREQMGVALARMMTTGVVDRLASIAESTPDGSSVRDMMRTRSKEIGDIMRDSGLVDQAKSSEYFTSDGTLTENAKETLESILAGLTVTKPAVLEGANPSVKDKLARAGIEFLRMKAAGSDWDIASYNTDAVQLLTRAQDNAAALRRMEGREVTGNEDHGSESLVERFLHPDRYRLSNLELGFDEQPLHPPVHPAVEALAMALEESPKEYVKTVGRYADSANEGGATMFGAEHPADVFTNKIGSKYGLKAIPEEWGLVNGLPDMVKAEIEDTRGPLPVEPQEAEESIAADIAPDNSSVDDSVKTEEPRSAQEFKRVLSTHPNITEEQAEALGDIFENIIPRAVGESFQDLLLNRKFSVGLGGKEGANRAYTEMLHDGQHIMRLFEGADTSSVLHEMFHVIRKYINPRDQAVLNKFVDAKGSEWSVDQEEMAARAFERYHFDGGRRRGFLDQAFSKINKAMQSIYNAVTGRQLAQPSKEVSEMFDRWYDWERTERKPIAERFNPDEIEKFVNSDKSEVPEGAKLVEQSGYRMKFKTGEFRVFAFIDDGQAREFIQDNSKTISQWQMYKSGEGKGYYVKFEPKGKKLYQSGVDDIPALARRARELEDRLKQVKDPREEAAIRAQLNAIDNKLGRSTLVLGGSPEPKNTEVKQLIYGVSEMPSTAEPTTPAQATTAKQIFGDPTAIELGGDRGHIGGVSQETTRVPNVEAVDRVSKQTRQADRGDEKSGPVPSGSGQERGERPLAKVKAAALQESERPRGTALVSPEQWAGYANALGLPEGTPPPTVRIPDDIRNMMIYPGQAEAVEGSLSALQQYDATILAAPTGSGKTYMNLAVADQLLGTSGDKVGLIVTRSKPLITKGDGYQDVGKKMGVEVELLPSKGDLSQMQTGMYAATYARIRGDKEILSVPWDFVIFDESAEARKWGDSAQGDAVVKLGHVAKKVVYSSATPFHTAVEIGYMHKLGMWPKGGFFSWARQFGVVEVGPNTYTGGYAPKRLLKLRQQLIERGQWQTLHRDMDGVSAHVAMVEMTPEVRQNIDQIRSVFRTVADIFKQQGKSRMAMVAAAHEVIYLKRYVESARLPEALDLTERAIKGGWNPVVFSEYRSGTTEGFDFFNKLPPGVGEQMNAALPKIPDMVDAFRERFGHKIGIFAGEANELRADERESFMNGDKNGLYATYAAGGVGVGFHDKVGDRPRMGVFLGLPWSGIMFEQSLGRNWRYSTASNVANVFLTSNSLPEMRLLATKILPRMRALNAAVYGADVETSLAKQLRESTGIPEEMIDYELGGDTNVEAAHFGHVGDGMNFTKVADLKLPKSADAAGKGMKYKQQPKRLYQGARNASPVATWLYHPEKGVLVDQAGRKAHEELLREAGVNRMAGTAFDEMARGKVRVDPYSQEMLVTVANADHFTDAVDRDLRYKFDVPNYYQTKVVNSLDYNRILYQGPLDEDPFIDAARRGLEKARRRLAADPVELSHAINSKSDAMAVLAGEEARNAAVAGGTTPPKPPSGGGGRPPELPDETPDNAANRKISDFELNARFWWDEVKENKRRRGDFIKNNLWTFGMSGDRAAEAVATRAGHPVEGAEIKRMLVLRQIKVSNHEGEMLSRVDNFLGEHKITPAEHEQVARIIEGKDNDPHDERISKVVQEYRDFFADIRQKLADKGVYVGVTDEGKQRKVYYRDVQDDPNYWPRIYDWKKKILLVDPSNGEKVVTTLGKLRDMPVTDEKRRRLIEAFAKQQGISPLKAELFFDKNRRGVRLAGNVERGRDTEMPGYGLDRRVVRSYIAQVAEKMADTEIFGQDREKVDPLIWSIRDEDARKMVNNIVTTDLRGHAMGEDDRYILRNAMRWVVASKMALSPLKLPTHYARISHATNMRSLVRLLLTETAHPIRSTKEVYGLARDAGALLDYTKQAWLREYGLHDTGIDRKLLDFNGFTFLNFIGRGLAAGTGRLWLEKYVYPELVKNPGNKVLRRKMNDLYGYTDAELDRMIRDGYNNEDIKRVAVGAAHWTTGGGRPSELPVAFRGTSDDPVMRKFLSLARINFLLHGYMFKTANLVNRTVFQEVRKGNYKPLVPFLIEFGAAGIFLHGLRQEMHHAKHSDEEGMEQRRIEYLKAHPHSAEALWYAMANVTLGMGVEPLTVLFDELATHDPKDKAKMQSQNRFLNSMVRDAAGTVLVDTYNLAASVKHYADTYRDTGNHRTTPSERREKILKDLAKQEVPVSGYALKPKEKTASASGPAATHPSRRVHRRERVH